MNFNKWSRLICGRKILVFFLLALPYLGFAASPVRSVDTKQQQLISQITRLRSQLQLKDKHLSDLRAQNRQLKQQKKVEQTKLNNLRNKCSRSSGASGSQQ